MIPAKSSRTSLNAHSGRPPPAVGPLGGTRTHPPFPAGTWQRELARAVTDLDELLRLVGIPAGAVGGDASGAGFPLRVRRPYIARMRSGDVDDPLLRQVLPTTAESTAMPGYRCDPLDEAAYVVDAGLLQKYHGRALLIAAGACAVNCRYCFRRHFPYGEHRQHRAFGSLEAIRRDSSISEVILSGGDPLMLTDSHLERLVGQLSAIGHVQRIRIHTRLPVVIPARVTATLIDALAAIRPRVVIVTHFNHPNEIDGDCIRALGALSRFTLLNQSVLLRGVNDDDRALIELSEGLFAAGVLPYYLHMPDAVAGTAHFDVSERRAVAVHRRVAARLPGYLVPRLVRETPGKTAKDLVVPV